MKLKAFAVVPCLAAVLFAGMARADTINGTVYQNQNPFKPGEALAAPTGEGTSFTVSKLNFFSGTPYTIGGFLNSNGALTSVLASGVANASLNNTIFDFTGTTNLVNGNSYTITHDDGMDLFLNTTFAGKILPNPTNCVICLVNVNNIGPHSGEVIASGLPTSAAPSTFTYLGPTGAVSFDLLYTEVNGAPATLQSLDFPTAVTPEPGTFALMGTGLLSLAGMMRRRMRA